MQNMTKTIVVATLFIASPMMADQRGNEKPKTSAQIESSMRCSDGSRGALCTPELVPARITFVSDRSQTTRPKKIVQVPWMIGAFQ